MIAIRMGWRQMLHFQRIRASIDFVLWGFCVSIIANPLPTVLVMLFDLLPRIPPFFCSYLLPVCHGWSLNYSIFLLFHSSTPPIFAREHFNIIMAILHTACACLVTRENRFQYKQRLITIILATWSTMFFMHMARLNCKQVKDVLFKRVLWREW